MTNLRFADSDELVKYMRRVMQSPRAFGLDRCILCSAAPDGIGVFIPDAASHQKFGGQPGKARAAMYGLCCACRDLPGCADLVEARLVADIQRQQPG